MLSSTPPRERRFLLPPTSTTLYADETSPYFLWWTDCTIGGLRGHLGDPDPEHRGYWMGALLREANSRDVWLFVTPDQIRHDWSHVVRHLGRTRAMWAWLLDMEPVHWPPQEGSGA